MPTRWAKRRKEHFRPDARLDWRDPDMPTFDVFGRHIAPAEVQREYARSMCEDEDVPKWREDPTYNLRRK